MYLRTPKRYQKQRRHVLSLRWLWLWILTPIVVITGWGLYNNRAEIAPPVADFINTVADSARTGMSTMTAPTPMPTENPGGRLVVADRAWSQGSIDEAVREYEDVIANVPNDVQAHYRLTLGYWIQGRVQEALAAAERTVTANPFSSDAWAIRSQALNAAGRQGEAIASAMQALQLNPDSARATAFLAEAYFDSNQIERALTKVEEALELDPTSFEALYVQGRIYNESLFEPDTAMEAFRAAYDSAPNMPHIGVEMAWVNFSLQEADAAFETLQGVVELNPQNSNALYALAYFSYAGFGDPNQALDYLSRCIETNPSSISCNYYMGTVQFGLGDNEAAAEAFMRVIDLGTTSPRHFLSAGRINSTLNNCSAAIPLLQQGYALEQSTLDPNPDRLLEFEDALQGCGVSLGAQSEAVDVVELTPEAEDTTGE